MNFPLTLPIGYRNANLGTTPVCPQTGGLVKNCVVLGWRLINLNGIITYLKFYDKATAPTIGTDIPVAIVPVFPSGVTEMEVMGNDHNQYVPREFFQLGLWIAATTGIADTDTTAPSTGLNVQLKFNQ